MWHYSCDCVSIYMCDWVWICMWDLVCGCEAQKDQHYSPTFTVTEWQNWDLSPGYLAPESLLLITKLSWFFPRCESEKWGPWVLRVLERIVLGLGLGTFWTWNLIWVSSFGPLVSHRTQSKHTVVRPSSYWPPLEGESLIWKPSIPLLRARSLRF